MKIVIYKGAPNDALDIRIEVFVREQGFVDDVDDVDAIAHHVVAYDKERAVACCRIFPGDDQSYILGRLAVLREYRGRGIGAEVASAAEKCALSLGAGCLRLHSQLAAKPFYEKLGYKAAGEVELEQGQPHVWMEKRLG